MPRKFFVKNLYSSTGWFISGLTMVYGKYNITIVNGDYKGL